MLFFLTILIPIVFGIINGIISSYKSLGVSTFIFVFLFERIAIARCEERGLDFFSYGLHTVIILLVLIILLIFSSIILYATDTQDGVFAFWLLVTLVAWIVVTPNYIEVMSQTEISSNISEDYEQEEYRNIDTLEEI